MEERIETGFQVFADDESEEFGAVREVAPKGRPEIVVYVENSGDFVVPLDAVAAVHSEKVILDRSKLDPQMLIAIAHAHDQEDPNL
jgi:hypothetical protein